MFCTKCGAELADGARFCTKCGAALATDGPAVQESAPVLDGAVAGDAAPVDAADTVAGEPPASADVAAAEPPAAAGDQAAAAGEPTAAAGDQAAAAGEPTAAAGTKLADAPDATSDSAKKKVRKPLLVAACVALVLVAGVGGAVALRGGGSAVPAALELVYGSNDVSAVARSARLVPLDGDGEPIAHYWIRFRRAVDADGEDIDLTDVEAFEVTGTDGFVIGDVLADLPDGTYYPVISDEEDGEDRPLPPVNVGNGEDASDGTITIKPDDEQKLSADALFLAKLETLQAQYGGPAIGVKKIADDMYLSALEGLAYAELADFGDGVERLALAYRSDWLMDGWDERSWKDTWSHAYTVEIWEYDEESDSISKVPSYDGKPMELSTRYFQGFSGILWPLSSGAKNGDVLHFDASSDRDHMGYAYYGLDDEGVFGHIATAEGPEPGAVETYLLDGKQVPYEVYEKAVDDSIVGSMEGSLGIPSLSAPYETEGDAKEGAKSAVTNSDALSVAGTKQRTLDTIEELRSRVEASARKDGDAAEAKDDADAKKSAAAQTVSAQAKTVDEAVTVPNYGRDFANPSDELVEWTYVSFDPADASDGVAKINAALKESFEAEKKATASWNTDDPGDGECVHYRSGCTYNDGAYAAVRIERRCTNWGPHGWAEIDGFVFDLKTGAEVSPWEVAGVSQAELEEAAVDAIVTYVQGHPGSDLSGADEIAAAARDEIAEGYATFLLTDKGVTVYLQDYSMGYAYADGDKEILVLPFDGGGAAGDNVRDAYSLMEGELMA